VKSADRATKRRRVIHTLKKFVVVFIFLFRLYRTLLFCAARYRELESTVEELRGNVINKKSRVNMSDVENMALVLSKSRYSYILYVLYTRTKGSIRISILLKNITPSSRGSPGNLVGRHKSVCVRKLITFFFVLLPHSLSLTLSPFHRSNEIVYDFF